MHLFRILFMVGLFATWFIFIFTIICQATQLIYDDGMMEYRKFAARDRLTVIMNEYEKNTRLNSKEQPAPILRPLKNPYTGKPCDEDGNSQDENGNTVDKNGNIIVKADEE